MAERIMLSRFEEVIWRIDRVATDLGCVRCCRPAMSIVPNVPRIPKRRARAPDSPTILFTTSALIEPIVVIVPLLSDARSEEHTSELQSLMRISYAVFCLKKKKNIL